MTSTRTTHRKVHHAGGDDFDISDIIQKKKSKDIFSERPLSTLLDVYIIGDIEEPENYIEVFDKIRSMGELDVIKLHINSCGGYLSTGVQFMRCLRDTPARVIASVEGDCMSCATILLLAATSFEISDHSSILCHHYRGGTAGRGNQMRDQLMFETRWSEKLFRHVYADFLTEEEITGMIEGKEIFLDSDETIERLKTRAVIREEREKLEAEQEDTE